jgi:hypothetical protein
MAFGKRQSGVGATATATAKALNGDVTLAHGQVPTATAQATGFPYRSLIALLACGAALYGLLVSYGPDLLRDHRLSGTWQPAYDY